MDMTWRKSKRSNANGGACVEVARGQGAIFARDSKNPDGPRLQFTPREWHGFLARVKEDAGH
jgi:hypothetical protein